MVGKIRMRLEDVELVLRRKLGEIERLKRRIMKLGGRIPTVERAFEGSILSFLHLF